jgi:hypothetical protein
MRPWILVCLCCLGLLGGGACSARPLLDISLTSGDGIALTGYPRIDVTRTSDGQSIKQVDKTDGRDVSALLILDNSAPTYVGVYLPSGTEADVVVSAELQATIGTCEVAGSSGAVHVKGGDATAVDIVLHKKQGECSSPRADAGMDGANDAPETRDALAGEATAPDAGNPVIDCFNYCQLFDALCSKWITDPDACLGDCENAHWNVGTQDVATGQDTFRCREVHLKVGADSALDCSECYAASPPSPGICASLVDAGARGPCPLYP